MRKDRFDASPRPELDDCIGVPVRVDARSYRRFTRWMDYELSRLVARWAHRAAPSARRSRRHRFPTVEIE